MKKLPPVLVCALAIRVVATFVLGLVRIFQTFEGFPVRFFLASDGVYVAADLLALVGFLELARRASGRVRTGLLLAAAGSALGLADTAFWLLVEYFQPHGRWLDAVGQYGWFIIDLVIVGGVTIAAAARHVKAAIAGVVVLLVTNPWPPIAASMWSWIHSERGGLVVHEVLRVAQAIAVLVLAVLAAPDGESPPAAESARYGLRVVASALWMRVIAAVSVASLTLMLMLGSPGEGSVGILKLAMLCGAVINVISFAMIARGAIGALRSGVADLPPWPLAACAAGILWCLGVLLHQLPYTYMLLYGGHGSAYGVDPQDYVQALALAVPLVATGAIAVVATTLAGFAARRGLEQLRSEAQGKGAGFVGLSLASIAIQTWLLPKADSLGSFALMTIVAAGCALSATVLMARLCALAADSLHAEPGLPPAKII